MTRFVRFAIAGSVGLLVDAAVLLLLLHTTTVGPYAARAAAICLALLATWQINRRFAFNPSSRHILAEGGRYGGVGLASALLNFLVYSGIIALRQDFPPLLALLISSASATAFSYAGYSRIVFDR